MSESRPQTVCGAVKRQGTPACRTALRPCPGTAQRSKHETRAGRPSVLAPPTGRRDEQRGGAEPLVHQPRLGVQEVECVGHLQQAVLDLQLCAWSAGTGLQLAIRASAGSGARGAGTRPQQQVRVRPHEERAAARCCSASSNKCPSMAAQTSACLRAARGRARTRQAQAAPLLRQRRRQRDARGALLAQQVCQRGEDRLGDEHELGARLLQRACEGREGGTAAGVGTRATGGSGKPRFFLI